MLTAIGGRVCDCCFGMWQWRCWYHAYGAVDKRSKHRTHVRHFVGGLLVMAWSFFVVMLAGRARFGWMGQLGWPAAFVTFNALVQFAFVFWCKDISRDWEDKIQFDLLSAVAAEAICGAGWNEICKFFGLPKSWTVQPPQELPRDEQSQHTKVEEE